MLVDAITDELTREVAKSLEPTADDLRDIATTAERATALIETYIGQTVIPQTVLSLAGLEVARELWTHRDAPAGIYTGFGDTAPVRLARDPLRGAYAILAPYLGASFA